MSVCYSSLCSTTTPATHLGANRLFCNPLGVTLNYKGLNYKKFLPEESFDSLTEI